MSKIRHAGKVVFWLVALWAVGSGLWFALTPAPENIWNTAYKTMYAAWYDGDFVRAASLSDRVLSKSFMKRGASREARQLLEEKLNEQPTAFKPFVRVFGRALLHVLDFKGLRRKAMVSIEMNERDAAIVAALSYFKAGKPAKAEAIFREHGAKPWGLASAPPELIRSVLEAGLARPEDPTSLAKVDILNLLLAGKTGKTVAAGAPGPWGNPYAYYVDPADPAVKERGNLALAPRDRRDPFESWNAPYPGPTTFLISTRTSSGGWFTYANDSREFLDVEPKGYFNLLPRLGRLYSGLRFELASSLAGKILATAAGIEGAAVEPSTFPFFVGEDGRTGGWVAPILDAWKKCGAGGREAIGRLRIRFGQWKEANVVSVRLGEDETAPFDIFPIYFEVPNYPYIHLGPPLAAEEKAAAESGLDPVPGYQDPARIIAAATMAQIGRGELRRPIVAWWHNCLSLGCVGDTHYGPDLPRVNYFYPLFDGRLPTWILADSRPARGEVKGGDLSLLESAVLKELAVPEARITRSKRGVRFSTSQGDVEMLVFASGPWKLIYFSAPGEAAAEESARNLLASVAAVSDGSK